MSLTSELAALRAKFRNAAPIEIRDAMDRAELDLASSGMMERALKAGDFAPDFELPGVDGRAIRLSALLREGPVVVSFYRGGWCPYCNLELRALQSIGPQIKALGAHLLAVPPERPDESLSTAEKNALAFLVLSDVGNQVARRFRITFDLAEALRPIYSRLGHALPDRNGDNSWSLPIPATYIIGQEGRIVLAFVDIDYRSRLDPVEVIKALQKLRSHAAA